MSENQPYVPASESPVEISPASFVLAIVLAIVLGAANAYLGLFAGMTVSASIPAAVIAMAVLTAFKGNILQANSVQTAASAGESLAAGVIFTLPALLLLGAWNEFHFWETTALAGLGGLLGVLFTIPLRRALIVDNPLKFPEGVATAEVLKVGESGGGVRFVGIGAAVGLLFKLGESGLKMFTESAAIAKSFGGSIAYIGTNLSPALVAVGYIVGLNIAVLVFLGGASNWLVAIPLYTALEGDAILGLYSGLDQTVGGLADTVEAIANRPPGAIAGGIWSDQTRYLGVGAMLVGGVWALIRLAPSLVTGIKASMGAYSNKSGGEVPRTERDTPMRIVFVLASAAIVPLFFICLHFTGSAPIAAFMAVFMLVAGFLFSAVAAYMAGLVGSSNNPISGVTIATILTVSLLLKAFGLNATIGPAAAIFVGSVVCCAAAIGGDNMQDLKAGHLLGSTPIKLQIMQVVGVVASVMAMSWVLNTLHDAYGIGSASLPAPQGVLMNSVSAGIFRGGLPWTMVAIGAVLAVAVIVVDLILEKKESSFRTPVLAYAVGIYLPFELSVPIFIGGLIAWLVDRKLKGAEAETPKRNGLLLAAGLITGEALMGILIAIAIVAGLLHGVLVIEPSFADGVLAVVTEAYGPLGIHESEIPGLILLAGVIYLLYRVASKRG
ncbi:MAG: oligopeptide transporter, OPT family [Deltaproteobacteria bacterium]|nr:oligopeptide transporter, OPT family [Deltaproteobacteria bacterium]